MKINKLGKLTFKKSQKVNTESSKLSDINAVLNSLNSDELKILQKNLDEIREVISHSKGDQAKSIKEKLDNLAGTNSKVALAISSLLGLGTGTLMGIVHNQHEILKKLDSLEEYLSKNSNQTQGTLNKGDIKETGDNVSISPEDAKYLVFLNKWDLFDHEPMKDIEDDSGAAGIIAGSGILAGLVAVPIAFIVPGAFIPALFAGFVVASLGLIAGASEAETPVSAVLADKRISEKTALERLKKGEPVYITLCKGTVGTPKIKTTKVNNLKELEALMKAHEMGWTPGD